MPEITAQFRTANPRKRHRDQDFIRSGFRIRHLLHHHAARRIPNKSSHIQFIPRLSSRPGSTMPAFGLFSIEQVEPLTQCLLIPGLTNVMPEGRLVIRKTLQYWLMIQQCRPMIKCLSEGICISTSGMSRPSSITHASGPKSASTVDYLPDDLLADAGPVHILKAAHVEAFPKDGLAEAQHVQAVRDGGRGDANISTCFSVT